MRIVRFRDREGGDRFGKESAEGRVFPALTPGFPPMGFAADAIEVSNCLAPVSPPNIIAIGRNYREHAEEMKAASPEAEPLIFLKATSSIIGHQDSIVLPASAPDEVDFEAELGVVIGHEARAVSVSEALDHVYGFACANDISARDCQKRRDKQWARGKSFDTFCPVGPVIVTPDGFDWGQAAIRSILNGRVMQESNTSEMIFSVAELVSYISHQFTLLPGTLILTGTPGGVGAARTPPVFLRPGDEICVEIEGIGRLGNRVVGPR